MTKYNFIISPDLSGNRVDKALSLLCEFVSRSQIQKAIKNQQLKVNDVIISNLSTIVKDNDQIEIIIIEAPQEHILPKDIKLDIIYEDEDLIVINKAVGMNSHPARGDHQDTLVNALLFHTNSLSDIGGNIRPGIVHRLDKNTSGLMVVAKNNKSHNFLAEEIKTRSLKRKYKALVFGMPKPMSGIIDEPLGRSRLDRTKMSILKRGGKSAITHYKVIESLQNGKLSIVECELETGRTHQIRVHLSHLRHSIVGDQTYGHNQRKIRIFEAEAKGELLKINHQLLHSFYISFIHPTSLERMEFEKEWPVDYNYLVSFMRNYRSNV